MKGYVSGLICCMLIAGSATTVDAKQARSKAQGSQKAVASQQFAQSAFSIDDVLSSYELAELTDIQKENLLFMYQEEKVARDVYEKLYESTDLRVFANIARSEQQHMDAIAALLARYSLETPVEDVRGVFANEELQALYDQLILQGESSLFAALEVGRDIEIVDIQDLESMSVGVPDDIALVYSMLLKGSQNHLAAFERLLERF